MLVKQNNAKDDGLELYTAFQIQNTSCDVPKNLPRFCCGGGISSCSLSLFSFKVA